MPMILMWVLVNADGERIGVQPVPLKPLMVPEVLIVLDELPSNPVIHSD